MSKYHFTGIAGVGMSAIAEAALQQGFEVTGSDRLLDSGRETQVLSALKSLGAELFSQDGSGVDDGTDAVVVSTAIEGDNPDLTAARSRSIKVLHRSDMLGLLTKGRGQRIAVSGTCGKSTVAGLSGWLLCGAGKDPTVINGAPLAGWMGPNAVGSARCGAGGVCVFEADESDRSLLNYDYETAVITNSFADHFDLAETNALFKEFAGRAQSVIDAREEGFFDGVLLRDRGFEYKSVGFEVSMPGRHNILNSVIAVKICEAAGCELSGLAEDLQKFAGVSRRLELVGKNGGVAVYDDYAHNTEKIRAAWQTLSGRHGSVAGIWRPHGYGPLKSMMEDLASMFSETVRSGDCLILLPVYDAGGTADRSLNTDELAERLHGCPGRVLFVQTPEEAMTQAIGSECEAVVTMGARDPDLPALARRVLAGL